jgi:AcrR family transcriptional regulator
MSIDEPKNECDMLKTQSRSKLDKERIVETAVGLADRIGLESFTIRKLAEAMDTAPMTLYHHIVSKEKLLDAMVDMVFGEITDPPVDQPWASAIRTRCQSARKVLNRHWWAAPLMESRTAPGRSNLKHHNAVIGCFRQAGFSVAFAARAYAVLDSFVYGFAFEEAILPGPAQELVEATAEIVEDLDLDEYPYMAEMAREYILKPGYNFGDSFDFGLDLLLEGLENFRTDNPQGWS